MAIADPPPGVNPSLLPELYQPASRPTSVRVITRAGASPAIRDLPLAALRAAAAATTYGEAWLVAPDHTYAHVDQDGAVHPSTGWAASAARTIQRTRTTA
jgi:hypothetical protein